MALYYEACLWQYCFAFVFIEPERSHSCSIQTFVDVPHSLSPCILSDACMMVSTLLGTASVGLHTLTGFVLFELLVCSRAYACTELSG